MHRVQMFKCSLVQMFNRFAFNVQKAGH